MTDDLLDVTFEVALKETVGFVQHEELTFIEQGIVLFDQIFEPSRCADHHLGDFVFNFSVVLPDHGASNEVFDVDFLEFADFLCQSLTLEGQFTSGDQNDSLDRLDFCVNLVE